MDRDVELGGDVLEDKNHQEEIESIECPAQIGRHGHVNLLARPAHLHAPLYCGHDSRSSRLALDLSAFFFLCAFGETPRVASSVAQPSRGAPRSEALSGFVPTFKRFLNTSS